MKYRLAILITLACLAFGNALAQGPCAPERPRFIFEALQKIDTVGEANLNAALQKLSKLRGWSQSEWESYALSLSDRPDVNKREARRDELMAQVFKVLSQPTKDCAALDAIEAEILQIEQQQWDEAIGRVQAEIAKSPSGGTL
jgi:hypothetical protein